MWTRGPEPGLPVDPLADLQPISGKVLAVVVLLAFALIMNNLAARMHLPIPDAIITVVIGVFTGGLIVWLPDGENTPTQYILHFEDRSALQFMLFFICPIIFAEGYGMQSRLFFDNLSRILSHAFLGTVISTVIVGVAVFNLAPLTGFSGATGTLTLAECLAFGSLISATDPVSTLVTFKQQGLVDKGLSHLYFTVLGESILNDAVGITLFDGFGEFVRNGKEITASELDDMAARFCVTFLGSMAVGVVSGILTALVLKIARMGAADEEDDHAHFNLAEVLVMFLMSYIPFLIATAVSPLSGIVAVLFAGMTSRHYAHYNLTAPTREAFLPIVELMATLCETYTFLLVGMGIFSFKDTYSLPLIGWTILFCLVGRAAQVYPIGYTVNCMSKSKKFTLREMHVSWFAGLRGAIAFMCALGFPENAASRNRPYFMSTTMVVVFLSMLALGWPTGWFLRVLKVGEEPTSVIEGMESQATGLVQSRIARTLDGNRAGLLDSGLRYLVMTPRAIAERKADLCGGGREAHGGHRGARECADPTLNSERSTSSSTVGSRKGQMIGARGGLGAIP